MTRFLEVEGNKGRGMHPFQILFARMGITVVLNSIYMWYKHIPDFPLGSEEVRLLLVARGLSGFFGVFGIYCRLRLNSSSYILLTASIDSLLYLPLADTTVITFLAPSLACWACSFLMNQPFTRIEQTAAYISLFGVILIARPTAFFSLGSSSPKISDSNVGVPLNGVKSSQLPDFANYENVTLQQRLRAVGVAMLGVVGAAGVYTSLRWIGKRAHTLITVNYFATWCTIVSCVMMNVLPSIGFLLPKSIKEWGYLGFLSICGFFMQFLLAAGLQYENSNRVTNMVYTRMLFALVFDKILFDISPSLLSIVGSSLILSSVIYVAVYKDTMTKPQRHYTREVAGSNCDEEQGFIPVDITGGDEEESYEMQNRRE